MIDDILAKRRRNAVACCSAEAVCYLVLRSEGGSILIPVVYRCWERQGAGVGVYSNVSHFPTSSQSCRSMTDTPRFAQVGGHAATIILANDSSIVNKPSTASEHAFYTQLGPSLHDDLIGTWTPAFYGTLTLQGQVQEDGQSITPLPDASSAVKEVSVERTQHHLWPREPLADACDLHRCWYWRI